MLTQHLDFSFTYSRFFFPTCDADLLEKNFDLFSKFYKVWKMEASCKLKIQRKTKYWGSGAYTISKITVDLQFSTNKIPCAGVTMNS